MEEIWKGAIYQKKDYSDSYEISNMGNLRNTKTKKQIKISIKKNIKYLFYGMYIKLDKKFKRVLLHKCVAESFLESIEGKEYVNHKDGNKRNNCVKNLEWCTFQENIDHAREINLIHDRKGVEHKNSKFSKEEILFIREHYNPKDKEFGEKALCKKFNVARSTIWKIIKKNSYIET